MKAWRIENDDGIDALNLVDMDIGDPGPGEVRVRIHASSINRRDMNTVLAPGARNTPLPRIPNSDGAGEVIAVGAGVTEFKPGDRVASCFFKRWPAGRITAPVMASALGGAEEGMLSEETILPEGALVPLPEHLSWEEAGTLTGRARRAQSGRYRAVARHRRRVDLRPSVREDDGRTHDRHVQKR